MAKIDITEKEAQRIAKERESRAKEKKKLFKKMVKEVKGANRRRVKDVLSSEKRKENARRKRVEQYKGWVKEQRELRRNSYQQRQTQLARQGRRRMSLLTGKQRRLNEEPGSRGEFAVNLGFLSGIFGFFAVMVVCFFFGANLSAVLFFGLLALVVFGLGGAFLAGSVEKLHPGFYLGKKLEEAAPVRGTMVDTLLDDALAVPGAAEAEPVVESGAAPSPADLTAVEQNNPESASGN